MAPVHTGNRVWRQRPTDSINEQGKRLYEKFNFRPVDIRKKYYAHDNENALVMMCELKDLKISTQVDITLKD